MIKIQPIDPVIFNILNFDIRWYGLSYILGIMLAIFVGKIILKKQYFSFYNPNILDDYIPYFVIGIVIGGRLGHVIFYELDYYSNNIFLVFKIWEGGMSFHGGLIGALISAYYFCKKKHLKVLEFIDLLILIAPIGLFFGRIANFINYELYGIASNLPWAVKVGQDIARHPTQIYEALSEGLILFALLNLLFLKYGKYFKNGTISSLGIIFYSVFRLIIEPFKYKEYFIFKVGFVKVDAGIILCIAMLLMGMIFLIKVSKKSLWNKAL